MNGLQKEIKAHGQTVLVLQGGGALSAADGLLLLAVASASIGYVAGARVSAVLPAEQVICWVLVLSLPLTLPLTLVTLGLFLLVLNALLLMLVARLIRGFTISGFWTAFFALGSVAASHWLSASRGSTAVEVHNGAALELGLGRRRSTQAP